MKVPSISDSSMKSGGLDAHQSNSLFQFVHRKLTSFIKVLDRIGTAIALGEKGDLDAAHEFRSKVSRAK